MKLKKLIAPIIATCFLVLFFLVYLIFCIFTSLPVPAKLLGLIIIGAFIGVAIFVLYERVQEVRSGEEDDLSKY